MATDHRPRAARDAQPAETPALHVVGQARHPPNIPRRTPAFIRFTAGLLNARTRACPAARPAQTPALHVVGQARHPPNIPPRTPAFIRFTAGLLNARTRACPAARTHKYVSSKTPRANTREAGSRAI